MSASSLSHFAAATRLAALTLVVSFTFCPAANAAADTESRLNTLEQRLASLESENAQLRARLGEVAAERAVPFATATTADRAKSLRVSGYTQIHAEFGGSPDARFNGTDDRFFIRRADIAVRGKLSHDFDFKIEGELSSGSLGEKSGHTPRLTDAFVHWQGSENLGLKVGQFKSPFGRAQLMPNTKLPWVERPLVSDCLTVGRQVGIAADGKVAVDTVPTTYHVGFYNGTGSNTSFSNNSQFMTAGRLETLIWSKDETQWTVAANAYHYDSGSDRRLGWGVDTSLSRGSLQIEAEYLNVDYATLNRTADGWWVSGQWKVAPAWEALLAVGSYDPDTLITHDDTLNWTIGTNYLLDGDNLKFSLNYLWGDSPTGQDGRILSRLQVKF